MMLFIFAPSLFDLNLTRLVLHILLFVLRALYRSFEPLLCRTNNEFSCFGACRPCRRDDIKNTSARDFTMRLFALCRSRARFCVCKPTELFLFARCSVHGMSFLSCLLPNHHTYNLFYFIHMTHEAAPNKIDVPYSPHSPPSTSSPLRTAHIHAAPLVLKNRLFVCILQRTHIILCFCLWYDVRTGDDRRKCCSRQSSKFFQEAIQPVLAFKLELLVHFT